MAKDLISQQKMPGALAPFSTGNAKADEALTRLSVWEHSPANPFDRPGGDDYDKACKAANSAGWKALLPILDDPGLFQVGGSEWDDDRVDRMSPAKKKEFRKVYEACEQAHKERIAFVAYLFEAVIPEGFKRLIEIASDDDVDSQVRYQAAVHLEVNFKKDKKKLAEISKVFDVASWDGEGHWYDRLGNACISCAHQVDPKRAFDQFSPLIKPAAVEKHSDRAECVIGTLFRGKGYDKRWAPALGLLVKSKADVVTCMALKNLPADPAVVPPILEALGDLKKIDYLWDGFLEVIARVPTKETIPIFQRAIALSPKDAEKIIKMIPAKAKATITALQSTPVVLEDNDGRKRPTLVFKKVKAFKAPRLPPLAKQQAEYKKMFVDGGIAAAYDKIALRAVVMIPKRVDESKLAVGATKLGGHPDLPADVKWPRVAKEPLTFLAQLRLADFAPLLPKGALPADGTLAIFVDNDASSKQGEYLQNARAIYSKKGAKLERREVPEDFYDVIYQACEVELREKISLPSPSNAHVTKRLDEATVESYENDVFTYGDALPQVLGYRDHGYDAEEPVTAQMLLQLICDSQTDMEFGDADNLSFFIDEKKLAKGDFSKIWPHCGD